MTDETSNAPADQPPAHFPPAVASAIYGEEREDFRLLEQAIAKAIVPTDAIEETWVEDLSDIIWQRRRLRRLRDGLYEATYPAAVVELLQTESSLERRLRWRDKEAIEMHRLWLKQGILSSHMVHAKALHLESASFEMLDRQMESLTKRHILIMREIREHRAFAVETVRAVESIGKRFEEAQYTVVTSEPLDGQRT
jgi:hypothetical protein